MTLIKLRTAMNITGLAHSTIYKYIVDGAFPKPIALGERSVA